jgi:hypothetical protein
MPTVVKTWAFASDAEGLTDAGVSAVAFAHLTTDGNPSGCVRFTQATKAVTQSERALRASTGETWESWGVPAGATVTGVQVTAWQEKLAANTKLSSHSISARVIGSGGASVHSAGDLLAAVALGTTTDATWQAGAAGTARAVDSGAQASGTDVRLELEYSVVTSGGGGSASVDQRFDQIQLTITYTESAPSITGDLSVTEAGDTLGATAVSPAAAAAMITEAGDTLGATAVSPVAAAAMITEVGDTFTAAGAAPIAAVSALTEAGDTTSAAAVSPIAASVTLAEAGDTLAAAGGGAIALATVNVTDSGDTLSAAGTSPITAAATLAEAGDTLAAAAAAQVKAAAVLAEGGDTISMTAVSPIAAAAALTETGDTLAAAAAAQAKAGAALMDAGDTLAATATAGSTITGNVILVEEGDSVTSTGEGVSAPQPVVERGRTVTVRFVIM